ncbi:MAG: CinA family protein [Pseudomonadales bacterium]
MSSFLRDELQDLGRSLSARALRLVTAESCTGGLIAASCTAIPGSSGWFEAGFVTYSAAAKCLMLGVGEQLITHYGVVSEPVARAMAEGALDRTSADIAVSVTGIAGPDGGDPLLPVGTVWVAWAVRGRPLVDTACHRLGGDRASVREQVVEVAVQGLLALIR